MHVYMLVTPKMYEREVLEAGLTHPDNAIGG